MLQLVYTISRPTKSLRIFKPQPTVADQNREMERGKTLQKILGSGWIVAVGTVVVMLLLTLPFVPSLGKQFRFVMFSKNKRTSGVLDEFYATYRAAYHQAFMDVQERVAELRHLEIENMKLRLRETELTKQLETSEYQCKVLKSEQITQEIRARLEEKTGARAGRMPSGIPYRVPMNLPPSDLYTLAASDLKAGENEKAALILDFLTNTEEKNPYQRPGDFVMAGVAWFRVQNYKAADAAFTRALGLDSRPEEEQQLAQARLWRALVARKLKKRDQEQYWMRQVMDHNPHSIESSWINPLDTNFRDPATTEKSEDREHGGEASHADPHSS